MGKGKFSEFDKNSNNIFIHIFLFCLIALLIYVKFPCPFKILFGIPCPACGTLHALDAIIKFNLYEYIRYNYLAVPMVSVVWLNIHKSLLLKNDKIIDIMTYSVCVLMIIRYFYEIYIDIFANI